MTTDKIAVVGMGCRFAGGVDSPAAFWQLLVDGRDGIGELPDGRWAPYERAGARSAATVRRATRTGGFLSGIENFDADFFGLSPREAELMDPQQRILLELAWEALEHAGIPPHALSGTDVGVFVGVGSDDYGRRLLEDLPNIEAWTGIGASFCAAANRISYALDLRGPSMAVDTACSASLVATHLACQSLRLGESTLALAAGVNLIVAPGLTLTLDAAGATAADGRSKSFDASADGYGRGEGAGVLVLKRLDDAERDGDRVLGVICGSAVHQDGRTNGIMAPSAEAQEYVLRQAYQRAGVDPTSVDYVEAHGTGTRMGDPIEASALGAVVGAGRSPGRPCLVGSVKSNIGHLEAGAGVAGIIKSVLSLEHGVIPPSLNFTEPNPAIAWDANGLRVVTEPTPWPDNDRPRRAGVSGFGYGGTVAHVVLEQAPPRLPASWPTTKRPRLFPLSAASDVALREYAGSVADWLDGPGRTERLDSVGHTMAARRSHLDRRATLVATDRVDLVAKLRHLADDQLLPGVSRGVVPGSEPLLVWVFSGHGGQWRGMCRGLLGEQAFAAVIDELEPVFEAEIGFSPRNVIRTGELRDVHEIQSMIFATQVALAAMWQHHGVRPDAVIGHSVGEIAAAVVAGVFDLADGARLVCRRSKLLRRAAGLGGMAMVSLGFDEVSDRLAGRADVVAAISAGPRSTVVSGDADAVAALTEQWRAEDLLVRKVNSDVAFHSPHMDDLVADLAAAAQDLNQHQPELPLYSTASADPRTNAPRDALYWVANLRQPVRFTEAVDAALQDGHRMFVEVSTHPVVTHSIIETLQHLGIDDGVVSGTLRRDHPELPALLSAAGTVHCHGGMIDWSRQYPHGDLVTLPTPAWQRRYHWRDTTSTVSAGGAGHDVDRHSLLGSPSRLSASRATLWHTYLDFDSRPYPGTHPIHGVEVVPAAVLLQTFLDAVSRRDRVVLADVRLRAPITVDSARDVQVVHDGGGVRVASHAHVDQSDGNQTWMINATAVLADDDRTPAPDVASAWRNGSRRYLDPGTVRDHLRDIGVADTGFAWQVTELTDEHDGIGAVVRVGTGTDTWAPLLDAVLSIAPVAIAGPPQLRLVARIGSMRIDGTPLTEAVVRIRRTGDPTILDAVVLDEDGRAAAAFSGLDYVPLDGRPGTGPEHLVHEMTWRELDTSGGPAAPAPRAVLLVGGDPDATGALREAIEAAGLPCRAVAAPADLDALDGIADSPSEILLMPQASTQDPASAAWALADAAQRVTAWNRRGVPRLWCVTVGVRECRDPHALAQAPLWGLGRVIAGEHPDIWGGLLDLDPDQPAGWAAALVRVLKSGAGEDVVAPRDGTDLVARLRPVTVDGAPSAVTCRADGTYVLTGGLGVLGLEVAKWLVERGARRLVLVSRRAFPARSEWNTIDDAATARQVEVIRELEASGVTVRVLSIDIADRAAVRDALAPDALGMPPVRGVVHLAGVLDNRLLGDLDEVSLRAVLRPKVVGAQVLHELFPPGSVDFLVFFSSAGLLLGLTGQASYAAANAFLDGLARHRRLTGHADTTSFGWTSWRGMGMAVNESVDAELAASGTGDITMAEAFDAWDLVSGHGNGHVAVLRTVDLGGFTPPPILRELRFGGAADPTTDEDDFAGLSPEELRGHVLTRIAGEVGAELKLPTADLDPDRPLADMGLDSVMSLVIRQRLGRRFGQALPATLLWHRPTVAALTDYFIERLAPR